MIVGSGAGGAVAAATLAEAGPRRPRARGRRPLRPRHLPADRLDAITSPLPRRRPDDRRGQPADPGPGGAGRRRHHGGQLRHLLPRPGGGARRLGERFGIDWAGDLDADFAEAEEMLRVQPLDPETMGRNGQLAMEGAAALGVSGGPIARNAGTARSAAPAPSAARSTPSAACTSATCRGRSPPERGCGPGSKSRRILVEDGRAVGVDCRVGRRDGAARRPFTVRARRAVIAAGGALGTPELLLRSGLGNARSAATSTSTPPAGSAPATRRRCAAGTA